MMRLVITAPKSFDCYYFMSVVTGLVGIKDKELSPEIDLGDWHYLRDEDCKDKNYLKYSIDAELLDIDAVETIALMKENLNLDFEYSFETALDLRESLYLSTWAMDYYWEAYAEIFKNHGDFSTMCYNRDLAKQQAQDQAQN